MRPGPDRTKEKASDVTQIVRDTDNYNILTKITCEAARDVIGRVAPKESMTTNRLAPAKHFSNTILCERNAANRDSHKEFKLNIVTGAKFIGWRDQTNC